MKNGRKLKRKGRGTTGGRRGTPKPIRRLMSLLWQAEPYSRCYLVATCGQVIERTLNGGQTGQEFEVTLKNLTEMIDRLERRLLGIYKKISMTVLRRVVHFCFVEIQRYFTQRIAPAEQRHERLAG